MLIWFLIALLHGLTPLCCELFFRLDQYFPRLLKIGCSVIYKYKCYCDVVYKKRTNHKVETCIAQHVLADLRSSSRSLSLRTTQSVDDSSILQHLLDNPDCTAEQDDTFFSGPSLPTIYEFSSLHIL